MALKWEADSTTNTTYYLKDEDNSNATVATITGLKSGVADSLPTEGTEIALTATELPESSGTVSISGEGYTISISDNLFKQEAQVGTYASGSVPILSKETSGWKPNAATGATSYTWTAAGTADTIATVTGMKSDAEAGAIEVSGTNGEITVTVKDGAVNTTTGTTTEVTLVDSDPYDDYDVTTLAAGFTTDKTEKTANDIALDTTTLANTTVKQNYYAYSEISGKKLKYTAASSENLATISGLQTAAVSLSGTTVNVSTSAVNGEVTLTNVGSATYTLAIDEDSDSDPTKEGFAPIAATWDITSGNVYKSAGTKEGWTLEDNATKIKHTAQVAPTDLLTLGGTALKDVTVENLTSYTEVDTENKTVDVLAGLLVDENAAANDKTVTITGTGYKLAAPGSGKLFNETGTVAVTTPDNGSAKVQKTQTAGWQSSGGSTTFTYMDTAVTNLATISGLPNEATVDDFTFGTGDDSLKITVSQNALKNGAAISNEGANTYSLAIDAAVLQEEEDDTASVTVSEVAGGTAKINYGLKEYWTVEGLSIVQHAAEAGKGSFLAQVTGLKTGADADNVEIGTGTSEGKIILKADALQNGASLANEAGQTFALAIDAAVLQKEEDDDTSITVGSVSNGTATINKGLKEYWTVEGLSIVQHAAEDGKGTAVATITGLSSAAVTGDVTLNSKEITLGQKAVGTAQIDLDAAAVDAGYELVLGAGINTLNNSPIGDGTLFVNGNTATVKENYKEYWELDSTNKNKVTYHALAQGAGNTVAEVTGLADDANGNVTLEGKVIKVKQEALKKDATTPAQITTGKDTYTLAFDGDVDAPNKNDGNPYLDVQDDGGAKVVKVLQDKTAGWMLDKQNASDTGNNKITYSTPEADEYAEISGLGDGVTVGTNISLGTGDNSKVITLEEGALKAGNVTLTDTASKGYKLALGTVTAPNAKPENEQAWDLSDITSGTAKYQGKTTAGWTKASNTSITYTAQETKDIVTITGLNARTAASDLTIDDTNKKIVVAGRALKQDDSTPIEITNNQPTYYTYSLSLADGIAAPATSIVDGTISDTFASGIITITGTKSAGWAIDSGKIKYTAEASGTIAQVTGLKNDAQRNTDYTVDTFNGVITLKRSALKDNTSVVLTPTAATYASPYVLKMKDDNGQETTTLGFDNNGYWEKKGSTANYYTSGAATGWRQNGEHEIKYETSGLAQLKVTLKNLDKNFTLGKSNPSLTYNDQIGTGTYTTGADNTFVAGVAVEGTTITLNKNILNTNETTPTAIEYADANYSVELNTTAGTGFVQTEAETKEKVWEYGSTTTYKEVELEYWTLDNETNKINYHPQTNETVLASITGLKSGVSAADISVNDDDDNNIDADSKFKITLNKQALTTRDVNITSTDYKLALQDTDGDTKVDEPVFGTPVWKLNGAKTIATYTAKVTTAGYTAASDGSSVTYTAATTGDNTITLAEVTGLNGNSDLKVLTGGQSIGTDDSTPALSFDSSDDKKIILTSDVLGTSNVEVTGTNYTLAFDDSDTTINKVTATEADDGEGHTTVTVTPPTDEDVWRVNGTTATYKKVTPAYYTLGIGATAITYTPEADVADGTFVTVEGLKSGLTVADDGQSLDGDNTGVLTIDNSGSDTAIVLTADALGNANITLTKGAAATGDYVLSLGNDEDAVADLKPHMEDSDNLTWVIDGTTAALRGVRTDGYELADDGQSITYTDTSPAYTFATLTGLNSGLTDADVNEGIEEDFTNETAPVITLDKTVLGTTTVAVTGVAVAGVTLEYTLDLATGANAPADSAEPINVWKINGTTATYHNATEAYYEVDTTKSNKEIKFIARVVDTQNPLATLSGLKSGLTTVDDGKRIEGIDETSLGSGEFTISRDVLGTSKVTISSDSPTFTLAADAAPEQTSEYYWTVSGTTAKYQFNSAAGYTQAEANTDIIYQAARSGNSANTVVTISGLKPGITKAIVEQGIVPDNKNEIFTLDGTVLGTGSATITLAMGNGADTTRENNYVLALASTDLKPQPNHTGWVKNTDGTYSLKEYTTAGYTVDTDGGSKIINYTAGTFDNDGNGTDDDDILKVKGLKANLTVKDVRTSAQADGGQIDGIVVSGTTNPTITLSKNVLTTDKATPVEITDGDGTLAINTVADSTGKVAAPEYSKAWAIRNGTATLTETITEGYTLNGNKVYYNPKEVVTTTISGLNTSVKVSDDKQEIGIETVSGQTKTYSGITAIASTTDATTGKPAAAKTGDITLDSTVLAAQTTVALTNKSTNNDSDYHLVLRGVTAQTADNRGWYKATNATTATYKEITAAGYTQTNDYKYTFNKTAVDTVYATLKGLDKTVTADTLNNTATIEVTDHTPDNPATTENEFAVGTFTIKDKSIFGKNNVTLASSNYVMAFDNDSNFHVAPISNADATWTYDGKKGTANLVAGKTEGWAFKTTTKNGVTTTDSKTILYTKAAPVTLATVTGLAKSTTNNPITLSADGKSLTYKVDGTEHQSLIASFSGNAGTILVDAGVLTTKTVKNSQTVESNAHVSVTTTAAAKKLSSNYAFTLEADGDVYLPEDTQNYWVADNGKAYYRYDTSAGYTPNATNTTLTYSPFKTTTLATISGLKSTVTTKNASTGELEHRNQIDGITVSKEFTSTEATTVNGRTTTTITPGTITLWDKNILGTKVTLGNKDNYTFEVASDIATASGGKKWYFKNGIATYRDFMNPGFEVNNKNSKLVESKGEIAGTTYVTISGLAKSTSDGTTTTAIDEARINQENLLIVNEDKTITLSDAIQGKTNITLANGVATKVGRTVTYYDYTIDTDSYKQRAVQEPEWTVANGTATLRQTTGAGFTFRDTTGTNGKQTLTYSKDTTATLATVKGIAADFAVLTEAQAAKYNTANAAAISAGTLNTVTAGDFYTVSTETVGNKKVTKYTAEADPLTYDANTKLITVKQDALVAKNVTISGKSGYKLALDSGVTKTAEDETGWVINSNGTSATYKNYKEAYHTLNTAGTAITYVKPTAGTAYATVTGLKKGVTADELNTVYAKTDNSDLTKGGVLTLDARHLGTSTVKIATTLKNTGNVDGFTLALSTSTDADKQVTKSALEKGVWSNNGKGTVTLSGTLGIGFTQEFGGKTLTYNNRDNKPVTIATITGLSNSVTVTDNSGVITLDTSDLTTKNVAITTNMGSIDYKLALQSVTAPTTDHTSAADASDYVSTEAAPKMPKAAGWTVSGSKGTLKGYVTEAGYTLAASGKSITYTGATAVNKKTVNKVDTYTYKDTTTLATITGLKSTADKNGLIVSDKITLTGTNTNGNLTLNAGVFAVEVADGYAGKTITGSAGADDLTIQAAGKTITGGKGDDKITLGGNTFVYNNGDGHDVIANFTNESKLQVNSGAISVGKVGNDVVVKVGAGSINLGDSYSGETIDIYAKDGKTKTTYAIANSASNVLLEDDNYSMNAASLSEIVQPDSATFTPYDFDGGFSLTKEDKLTPAISYNNSDKK